jgi:hypothetical protein
MSRANSLPDLLSFEKHFEDAAVSFFTTNLSVAVFPTASLQEFITPRLEVIFTTGEAELPNDKPIDTSPALALAEYRKFTAIFQAVIVTDNALEQSRDDHLKLVGQVRAELLRSADNWNRSNLPFYDLKFLKHQQSFREVEGDQIRTTLIYDLRFAIRDDTWPQS